MVKGDDYNDLQAAQERFIEKVYKLREAYLGKLIEIGIKSDDKKGSKEILNYLKDFEKSFKMDENSQYDVKIQALLDNGIKSVTEKLKE